MPNYKNQHLVPACYLQNFLADETEEQKSNPHFEQGVFVKNYSVQRDWKLRGLSHNVFTKSYYYNLKGDNENPIIEKYLGSIEAELAKYLREIQAGKLSNEAVSFFSFYTMLQFMRVEKNLNMQTSWNQVATTLDDFSRNQKKHGAIFEDLAKKQLLDSDFGDIVYEDAHLIYNNTNISFMTSDSPVVRRQVNISDITDLLPSKYLISSKDESVEERLFFFPLTPEIAYISSPLIRTCENRRILVDDICYVVFLNTATILNASINVYSSFKPPKQVDQETSKYIQSDQRRGFYAKIYGNGSRVIATLVKSESGRNDIKLLLEHGSDLKPFSEGDDISLCEVVKNGCSIRGMRECNVSAIDHEIGSITIESRFKI
jgi:hypothetical protein